FISLLGIICIFEYSRLIQAKPYFFISIFLLFSCLFSFLELPENSIFALLTATLATNVLLIYDLFRNKQTSFRFSFLYLLGGLLFITMIPVISKVYTPGLIAGVFILIWTNDVFAYLVGKSV